jgi:hypothetical protein
MFVLSIVFDEFVSLCTFICEMLYILVRLHYNLSFTVCTVGLGSAIIFFNCLMIWFCHNLFFLTVSVFWIQNVSVLLA